LSILVLLLESSLFVVDIGIAVVVVDDGVVVGNIRRRGVPNIADEPLVNVMEDEDDGILFCWAAATDESNEIIDNNEINTDVHFI
jgi:hypothetical protein